MSECSYHGALSHRYCSTGVYSFVCLLILLLEWSTVTIMVSAHNIVSVVSTRYHGQSHTIVRVVNTIMASAHTIVRVVNTRYHGQCSYYC